MKDPFLKGLEGLSAALGPGPDGVGRPVAAAAVRIEEQEAARHLEGRTVAAERALVVAVAIARSHMPRSPRPLSTTVVNDVVRQTKN